MRKGEVLELAYTLQQSCPLVPALHGVECVPSYFIVAGLVFVPLSIPFLEHAYGSKPPLCTSPTPFLCVALSIARLCRANSNIVETGCQCMTLVVGFREKLVPPSPGADY